MNKTNLPSLAGLRAFEATARQQSYAAAARELGVTDAAIRQHIHALEEYFGRALVVRRGRTIALTDPAVRFASAVAASFGTLQSAISDLQNFESDRPLRIALTPAFAENWLMPRLGEFWSRHPDFEIEMSPSIKVAELKEGEFDMAIRYGHGKWPGCQSEFLASAGYVVVAASEFIDTDNPLSLAECSDLTWLFESSRTEHQLWAQTNGIDFHAKRNQFYPTNSLVLSAVRSGYGLSVQSEALIENDLQQSTLKRIHTEEAGTLGYYIVTQKFRRKKLNHFIDWLLGMRES